MCTLTTLVILTSGIWDSGLDGAALTTEAFSLVIGKGASGFIAVSILFLPYPQFWDGIAMAPAAWVFIREKKHASHLPIFILSCNHCRCHYAAIFRLEHFRYAELAYVFTKCHISFAAAQRCFSLYERRVSVSRERLIFLVAMAGGGRRQFLGKNDFKRLSL